MEPLRRTAAALFHSPFFAANFAAVLPAISKSPVIFAAFNVRYDWTNFDIVPYRAKTLSKTRMQPLDHLVHVRIVGGELGLRRYSI